MKGKRVIILASLALLLTAGLTYADCGAAAAWVESFEGPLPSTYEEIAAYPPAHRRALFAALPAAGKSRVWRAHLERWVQTQPGLEAGGRAVIEEAMALLETDIFEVMDNPARRQAHVDRLRALEERAVGVMTTAQMSDAFMDLGSVPAATADIEPIATECNCATGPAGTVQACPRGTSCQDGGCQNDSGAGCGLFHYVPCHGICVGSVDIEPIEGL